MLSVFYIQFQQDKKNKLLGLYDKIKIADIYLFTGLDLSNSYLRGQNVFNSSQYIILVQCGKGSLFFDEPASLFLQLFIDKMDFEKEIFCW